MLHRAEAVIIAGRASITYSVGRRPREVHNFLPVIGRSACNGCFGERVLEFRQRGRHCATSALGIVPSELAYGLSCCTGAAVALWSFLSA